MPTEFHRLFLIIQSCCVHSNDGQQSRCFFYLFYNQHVAMRGPHRRGSRLARWTFRRHQRRRAWLAKERAELAEDLSRWTELAIKRRALFDAAEARGVDWQAQAEAQGLPVDAKSLALHNACAKLIAARALRRGIPFWRRSPQSDLMGVALPCSNWREYERAAAMPSGAANRAVLSDSLSFPLTAAYAARVARVSATPDTDKQCLSLLILGAEVGSELSGRAAKWGELLGSGHGLGTVRELRVCFVGPRVPRRLDGTQRTATIPMSAEGDGTPRSCSRLHANGPQLYHLCQARCAS